MPGRIVNGGGGMLKSASFGLIGGPLMWAGMASAAGASRGGDSDGGPGSGSLGGAFIRRRTGRRHLANHAVVPCGNDPVDRSDRPAAPIDHDAHEDLTGIDGAQHICRSFTLWWPQR